MSTATAHSLSVGAFTCVMKAPHMRLHCTSNLTLMPATRRRQASRQAMSLTLWSICTRYRADQGKGSFYRPQAWQVEAMLPAWASWAASQGDMSRSQKTWCRGPEGNCVDGFDAVIAGITFACAKQQRSAKAKSCTVMVRAGAGR